MTRVALVSGGSRGIGAAISKALQATGYKVAANYAGNDAVAAKFKEETGIPELIWLEKRPCRFCGGGWVTVCLHSGRTAAKLRLPSGGRRFLSRHAYRMGYRSQLRGSGRPRDAQTGPACRSA